MKRVLQSIVMSFVAVLLLMSGTFSYTQVAAQRFGSTTSSTTTHLFQDIITEDRVQNALFMTAFEEYKLGVDQFVLHDINVEDSGGSSVDEVSDGFVASVEGQYYELTETESYLSYIYSEGESSYAELLFYFVNEELYFIGLSNLQVDINMSEFVANDTMQTWVDENASIGTLASESFRIAGISEVLFDGSVYHMIMIPTGDSEDALNIDYTILAEDTVTESYMLDFYYSFNSPQDNMIQYFAYYLGISEEIPVAE